MKKSFLLSFYSLFIISCFAQSNYKVTDGQETKFKEKYKLTAGLDEKKHILYVETNAKVKIAVLEVFTPEQMAVRKGIEINKFDQPAKFSFDLNAPKYKDQYVYWLKVSTTDFPYQEILFTRITKPATNSNKKTTANTPRVEEEPVTADDDQAHPVLKTNIKCESGKTKVIKALKALDGVFEVKIDIKTGILKLNYSSDGTPLIDIMTEINNAGFDVQDDVDGWGLKKSTKPSANPCKTKNSEKTVSQVQEPKVEENTVKQTEIVLTDEEREQFGDNKPTIITTNIKCEAGSKKVSKALLKIDGVFKVAIDIKTGKLSILYSKGDEGPQYEYIIQEINNAGFDADDKKTTKASANPCKTKTAK